MLKILMGKISQSVKQCYYESTELGGKMKKIFALVTIVTLLLCACDNGLPNNTPGNNTNPGTETPGTNPDKPGSNPDNPPASSLISLDQLSSFRANISNATALGISKSTVGSSKSEYVARALSRDFETTHSYLVKSDTVYDANNPSYDTSGLTAVTFTRTTTDEYETVTEGEKENIIATATPIIPIISDYIVDSIIINANTAYKYKLVNTNGTEITDWIIPTEDTITFSNVNTAEKNIKFSVVEISTNHVISAETVSVADTTYCGVLVSNDLSHSYNIKIAEELVSDWSESSDSIVAFNNLSFTDKSSVMAVAKSKNAVISFFATEGFTYSVKLNGTEIVINITDNCSADLSSLSGVIEIGGLLEDESYTVAYKGNGIEQTITQDDIDGEIDKVYVLNNYTFISFVPKGTFKRPSNDDLTYDIDGISVYDKSDYYSANDRQSFVIDNSTGYIYSIKDFHISKIQGGCIFSNNSGFIYDFKVNSDSSLEFYPLFGNDTVTIYDCFKDKFGNKYILNNKINEFDSSTNTQFYVIDQNYSDKLFTYKLTSEGYALKANIGPNWKLVLSAQIMDKNGVWRNLNASDNFDVLSSINNADGYYIYKVENGILYGLGGTISSWTTWVDLYFYDSLNNEYRSCWTDWSRSNFNATYVQEFGVILEEFDGKLYAIYDVFDYIKQYSRANDNNSYYTFVDKEYSKREVLLEKCSIENNSVLTYRIWGNTYYDAVVEEDASGTPKVKFYETGTYVTEPKKIILQPLNKN